MDESRVPIVIRRQAPRAVTYDLSTAGQVKITLPSSSTWSSGLHWHETHDEYLKVIKGSIRVRLGNTTQVISATGEDQPELRVARYVWHEWQRAAPDGREVVVIERTEPDDNDKAVFFWNLNGVILHTPGDIMRSPSVLVRRLPAKVRGLYVDFWITLSLFVVFRYLDNVPVFLNVPGLLGRHNGAVGDVLGGLDWAVSHLVLLSASWVGWALGAKPVQLRYTPGGAYTAWWSRRAAGARRAV